MQKVLIVIGCIFGALILVIIALMIFFAIFTSQNNSYKGDFTSVLKSKEASPKKALVVFQPSVTGSASTDIANELARGLNEAGYEVTLTYPGKHLSADVSAYSLLAFGSSIYIGQPSTQLTDTMKLIPDYSGKKIILFAVGGNTPAPEFDVLKAALGGAAVDYTEKFVVGEADKAQKAYNLGQKAGKE